MQQPPHAPYGFMAPQGSPPPPKDISWLIALLVGGAVLVVLIPILIFAAVFLERPYSVYTSAPPVVAAFTPSSTPVAEGTPLPTPMPAPCGIVDATFGGLGGLPSAFTAQYGKPASGGAYTFKIASHDVHMTLKTFKGADGYTHVSQVVLAFVGKGFSASDTDQLIAPLLHRCCRLMPMAGWRMAMQHTTPSSSRMTQLERCFPRAGRTSTFSARL